MASLTSTRGRAGGALCRESRTGSRGGSRSSERLLGPGCGEAALCPPPPPPLHARLPVPGPGPGHWVSHNHIPASIAHAGDSQAGAGSHAVCGHALCPRASCVRDPLLAPGPGWPPTHCCPAGGHSSLEEPEVGGPHPSEALRDIPRLSGSPRANGYPSLSRPHPQAPLPGGGEQVLGKGSLRRGLLTHLSHIKTKTERSSVPESPAPCVICHTFCPSLQQGALP